jgi:hypothetical protein
MRPVGARVRWVGGDAGWLDLCVRACVRAGEGGIPACLVVLTFGQWRRHICSLSLSLSSLLFIASQRRLNAHAVQVSTQQLRISQSEPKTANSRPVATLETLVEQARCVVVVRWRWRCTRRHPLSPSPSHARATPRPPSPFWAAGSCGALGVSGRVGRMQASGYRRETDGLSCLVLFCRLVWTYVLRFRERVCNVGLSR